MKRFILFLVLAFMASNADAAKLTTQTEILGADVSDTAILWVDEASSTASYKIQASELKSYINAGASSVSLTTYDVVLEKTANYTVTAVDVSRTLIGVSNTTDITITLPNSSQVGACVDVIRKNTGEVTLAADTGAELFGTDTYSLRAQNSYARACVLASGDWYLVGDFAASSCVYCAGVNFQSGNYTVTESDIGNMIYGNGASAQTITFPTSATVPWTVGDLVYMADHSVSATISISFTQPQTVLNADTLVICEDYKDAYAHYIDVDTWKVGGCLAP